MNFLNKSQTKKSIREADFLFEHPKMNPNKAVRARKVAWEADFLFERSFVFLQRYAWRLHFVKIHNNVISSGEFKQARLSARLVTT